MEDRERWALVKKNKKKAEKSKEYFKIKAAQSASVKYTFIKVELELS